MSGSNQRPPMPRFAATYLSFFAAKSVCIGVYPWLKPGSVAAWLLQVFRVFRGEFSSFFFCVKFFVWLRLCCSKFYPAYPAYLCLTISLLKYLDGRRERGK